MNTATRHERVLLLYDETPTMAMGVRFYVTPTTVIRMLRNAGGKEERNRSWTHCQDTWFFYVPTSGKAEQFLDSYCENYRVEMLEGELYESLRTIRHAKEDCPADRMLLRQSIKHLKEAIANLDPDCPSYSLFYSEDGSRSEHSPLAGWLRDFTWSPEVRERTADIAIAVLEENYEEATTLRNKVRELKARAQEPCPNLRS